MHKIEFFTLGTPAPAGSKRAFAIRKGGVYTGRVAVTDDAGQRGKLWRQDVQTAAANEMRLKRIDLLTGPVALAITFMLKRPQGHYGTGKNQDTLRAGAPLFPTTKPDATKLLRAVEDALTGIVWRDDAQIVLQTVQKMYCRTRTEQPGCWVNIREQ